MRPVELIALLLMVLDWLRLRQRVPHWQWRLFAWVRIGNCCRCIWPSPAP
jgi:hypothetical protein